MEFSGSMSKIYSIMYLQLTVKYVMKYLYTLIALWTFTVTAHSEPRELSKRIICDTRNSIFTQLIEDYKEQPVLDLDRICCRLGLCAGSGRKLQFTLGNIHIAQMGLQA